MTGDKVTIEFDGKSVECTEVQAGVVQKTASIFYIQDCVSKAWLYCFPARLAKLNAKYEGDLSGFKGRTTKALEREAAKAAKAAKAAAKAAAAEAKAAEPVAMAAASAGE